MKKKQIPEKKNRWYLKMGLGVLTVIGLISIAVAVDISFRPWEKTKMPQKQKKMVSVRIIDVPYKGQIFEKDKAVVIEDSILTAKEEADSLPVKAVEAGVPLQKPLESEKIPDEAVTVSKGETSQPPSELKGKFAKIVASLDNVQLKAKAAAAEPPKIEPHDSKSPSLIKNSVTDEKSPFTVQVGVFRNKRYANRKAAELKTLNYPAFIHEIMGKDQQTLYLVCFGHFMTREKTVPAMTAFKEKENLDAVVAFLK